MPGSQRPNKEVIRVVSLVPSWTETLSEAGAHIVGRTRFCIHPEVKIKKSRVVGGTKSLDIELLRSLDPDLIVMDREENTLEMFEQASAIAQTYVSHVESVHQMPTELSRLAKEFAASDTAEESSVARSLHNFSDRYAKILKQKLKIQAAERIGEQTFAYCIWKDPWMAVGANTFITSMLEHVGFDLKNLRPISEVKYPKFEPRDLPPHAHVFLSTEPFPFAKKIDEIRLENPWLEFEMIDGERFSWFGIRALNFLEQHVN